MKRRVLKHYVDMALLLYSANHAKKKKNTHTQKIFKILTTLKYLISKYKSGTAIVLIKSDFYETNIERTTWYRMQTLLEISDYYYYYYYYSSRVFRISVSWWFFTGVWVTASLLKSPGLVSVFWPSLARLSFG